MIWPPGVRPGLVILWLLVLFGSAVKHLNFVVNKESSLDKLTTYIVLKKKKIWYTINFFFLTFSLAFLQLMLPFQEDSAVVVEENTDIPDYLPEDESPSQEQDKAVTRVGSITDGMGWLSTAANFLSRSFYWWQLPAFLCLLAIISKVPSSCRFRTSKPRPRLSPASLV